MHDNKFNDKRMLKISLIIQPNLHMTIANYICALCLLGFVQTTVAKTIPNKPIVVFAAASLSNAISDIATLYTQTHGTAVKKSFAASSVLAKQIQRGAPADIYIAADQRWMNHLSKQRLIQANSRQNLITNRLALVVPLYRKNKTKFTNLAFKPSFAFSQSFNGKLCTGQVDTVPIGVYAKQALTHLNWWQSIKTRVVGAQNVRTALAYVERGECDAGIVYQTDGLVAKKAKIVGLFPQATHTPIRYPVALTLRAKSHAQHFIDFLFSPSAQTIFKKYGFQLITPA